MEDVLLLWAFKRGMWSQLRYLLWNKASFGFNTNINMRLLSNSRNKNRCCLLRGANSMPHFWNCPRAPSMHWTSTSVTLWGYPGHRGMFTCWPGNHMSPSLLPGQHVWLNRATSSQWIEPKNGFLHLSIHISFNYSIIHPRRGQVRVSGRQRQGQHSIYYCILFFWEL